MFVNLKLRLPFHKGFIFCWNINGRGKKRSIRQCLFAPISECFNLHGSRSCSRNWKSLKQEITFFSLKAENFGNDPNISLVPASGGGWGSQQQQPTGQQQLVDNHHQQQQQQNSAVDSLNNSTGKFIPENLGVHSHDHFLKNDYNHFKSLLSFV
jgi:hypothetical protein